MSQSNEQVLRVVCADLPAPPLFWRDETGQRFGYEADVARLLAKKMGRSCEFIYKNWGDFYPALDKNEGDMLLCGQGISDYRKTLGHFTEPYAIFDEAVMVMRGSPIKSASDLVGKRVGAIENSLNMALAETFEGCITVPFSGDTEDVMGDMVKALRKGEVDAFVDDDVALVPLADEDDLDIAFIVETQNKWGIAVGQKTPSSWLAEIDKALLEIKQDGSLRKVWKQWMPTLRYPF